jgi:dihydroxyacid dehydratase/phosphogluconate dehydratase
MEEIYQVTSALKFVPWGKRVPVVTDGRFSGVSTGACIGHVGPEALAGGPLGRLRDGDEIEIEIDRVGLTARVDLVGADAARLLRERPLHPGLAPHPELPDDTRLWAALQEVSGGTWAGCVYDVERILAVLAVGRRALDEPARASGAQRHPDEDRGAADHR